MMFQITYYLFIVLLLARALTLDLLECFSQFLLLLLIFLHLCLQFLLFGSCFLHPVNALLSLLLLHIYPLFFHVLHLPPQRDVFTGHLLQSSTGLIYPLFEVSHDLHLLILSFLICALMLLLST